MKKRIQDIVAQFWGPSHADLEAIAYERSRDFFLQ